ncbi:MAG: 3-oxoacyl-[acyl-carrier-protein] reductase [Spirochaetales bacterium]|nr:3-oxoacyl-[acyl-carrier-protein] reductase [Spirochaetales bacterium]MCF7937505.1 3-oxoacyl-[acyl-carrier-protein] reductase [Spirochaetales bacterium]
MLLEGKTAFVTGGARGIGKEIIMKFLSEGASIYFVDLNESEHIDDYRKAAEPHGGSVIFKKANVADEEEISGVTKEILDESGGIDVLVNNAGITRDGLVFRMSSKDWQDVLNINLTSAFYISKLVSHAMIRKKTGSIINVASIVGVIGNAGQTNYSASKAGLIGFTKSLAREVASRGVRVNAVAPGFIQTPMTDKLNDEQREKLMSQIPLGRLGQPEEVAKVILFLASDLSSYLTGQVIKIDGGMGM